jgi:hypothetical protein
VRDSAQHPVISAAASVAAESPDRMTGAFSGQLVRAAFLDAYVPPSVKGGHQAAVVYVLQLLNSASARNQSSSGLPIGDPRSIQNL